MKAEYGERLNAVKIAYREYFTMEDYTTDSTVHATATDDDEDWVGEDYGLLQGIPDDLVRRSH